MEESIVTLHLLDYSKSLLNYYSFLGISKETIAFLGDYSNRIKTAEYHSSKYTSAVQPSIKPV